MATKAELEIQLAEMRAELAEARKIPAEAEADPAGAKQEPNAAQSKASPIKATEQQFEHLVGEFRKELEQVSHDKPLLTALAAFMVGFMLARGK